MNRLAAIIAAASLLASSGQTNVWAQGGKTPTYPVVPLSVVVETGEPYRITGDEAGSYEHGAPDGTTANIDKYGNVIISFGRPVNFDYGARLSGVGGALSGPYDNSYISTLNAGGKAIQNLLDGESQCIKLNWQYDVSGGMLRHGFNRGLDQYAQDDTSYAVVTRTNGTWVVEPSPGNVLEPSPGNCEIDPTYYPDPDPNPDGTYTNPDSVGLVFSQVSRKGKWVVTEYGKYSLPFKLTLTPK